MYSEEAYCPLHLTTTKEGLVKAIVEEGLVKAIIHYKHQIRRCREVLNEAQNWVRCDKDCRVARTKYGCSCGAEEFNAAINVVLKETE